MDVGQKLPIILGKITSKKIIQRAIFIFSYNVTKYPYFMKQEDLELNLSCFLQNLRVFLTVMIFSRKNE